MAETSADPTPIGFYLLPNYSMIAFASALEVLRMANRSAAKPLYAWHVQGAIGDQTPASNGLVVQAGADTAELDRCETVYVCGGIDVQLATTEAVRGQIRRRASRGQRLGAVCTGSHALASAGVLDGYRCAVHWEDHARLREGFPRVDFVREIFVTDRDRDTCTGGVAPLHMMLQRVHRHHGKRLALAIAEQYIVERMRAADDCQRLPQPECIGPGYQHLVAAVELMQANIDEPLPLPELAAAIQVSVRQLERIFQRYHRIGPAQYYLNVRLQRARELLTISALPIMQITVACGFQSSSHFCKAYRTLFGMAPSEVRRQLVRSGGHSRSDRTRTLPVAA